MSRATRRGGAATGIRAAGIRAAGIGLAGVGVANAVPAISSARGLRVALAPALSGVGRRGQLAFTFDDGPDPVSTPLFLELLADRGIRATFFLLGFMVRRSPGLAAEIATAGHEIGVHGDAHRNLLFRDPVSTMADIRRGRDVIADAAGIEPRWYRPPYGILTSSAAIGAKRAGLRPVLWTTWGWDWSARSTPDSVGRTVRRHLGDAGTVLLHDADCTSAPGAWRSTLGALPGLLDDCQSRGWRPVTLSEHLEGPA